MNIYREKWPLFLRDWSNNKLSYIYLTLLHIYNITSLTIPNILSLYQFSHVILPSHWWRGQERIPPIPLELLVCDLVVGVRPASATSNLKKGVNRYIWMKLNTNDGNKIQLWIFLLTHLILFFRVAPLILGCRVVDELTNIVSTEIIPAILPQALYEK